MGSNQNGSTKEGRATPNNRRQRRVLCTTKTQGEM